MRRKHSTAPGGSRHRRECLGAEGAARQIYDARSHPYKNARPKAVVETWIGVFVDKSENVREVYGKVPPRLDGVLVLVREIPVLVWCLSVAEGSDCSKDSPNCVTLEGEAHSCEKEFKTQAQCELGAAKYVHDSYVDADKNGDVVVIAPKVYCWENTDPTSSQWDPTWDPTTEKAVPYKQ